MAGMYMRDQIENWVSDFCTSDSLRPFPAAIKEIAADVLVSFLVQACDRRDVEPGDIEEPDVKAALLEQIARLNLPESVRGEVPNLCGTFLAWLEAEGRLSGGRAMGAFVGALKPSFLETGEAARGKMKPIVNAGSKIGRNDPCPCGSGKKYKKCCGT